MNILPCMRAWYELTADIEAAGGNVLVYEPVTALESKAIKALAPGNVTYPVGCGPKRFARQVQGATQLTARQRAYVWALVWRFRRQVKDASLISEAKRIGGPA